MEGGRERGRRGRQGSREEGKKKGRVEEQQGRRVLSL